MGVLPGVNKTTLLLGVISLHFDKMGNGVHPPWIKCRKSWGVFSSSNETTKTRWFNSPTSRRRSRLPLRGDGQRGGPAGLCQADKGVLKNLGICLGKKVIFEYGRENTWNIHWHENTCWIFFVFDVFFFTVSLGSHGRDEDHPHGSHHGKVAIWTHTICGWFVFVPLPNAQFMAYLPTKNG